MPRALSHGAHLGLTLGFVVLGQLGAHLDGWYHIHYGFAIESFWTWPHLMLWNGLLMVAATDMWRYLPAVAAGALAGEAVWSAMRRGGLGGPDGEAGYRLLAFLVPAVQFAAYLGLAALMGGGLAWPVHLAAGALLLAGLYGVITSGFAIPPRALRAS